MNPGSLPFGPFGPFGGLFGGAPFGGCGPFGPLNGLGLGPLNGLFGGFGPFGGPCGAPAIAGPGCGPCGAPALGPIAPFGGFPFAGLPAVGDCGPCAAPIAAPFSFAGAGYPFGADLGLPYGAGLPFGADFGASYPFGLSGLGGLGGFNTFGNITPLAMPFDNLGLSSLNPFSTLPYSFGAALPPAATLPAATLPPATGAAPPTLSGFGAQALTLPPNFNVLPPNFTMSSSPFFGYGGLPITGFQGLSPYACTAPFSGAPIPFRGSITPLAFPGLAGCGAGGCPTVSGCAGGVCAL